MSERTCNVCIGQIVAARLGIAATATIARHNRSRRTSGIAILFTKMYGGTAPAQAPAIGLMPSEAT